MNIVFVYWIDINRVEENKCVFMVPFYLSKINNIKCKIVWNFINFDSWYKNREWKIDLVNVWFKWFLGWWNINIIKYIIFNYKEIDILWLVHINRYNLLWIFIYKLLRPNWKIYIKLDDNSKKEKSFLHKKIINYLIWGLCDVISVETMEWYKKYKKFWDTIKNKLIYMPNWYHNELIEQLFPTIKSWDEKDNTIITVSRIWNPKKNNELMLNIIEKLSLDNRNFYFIWPIDQGFKVKIKDFYKRNPHLKWKVIFTWPIYDRKELYNYYNNAKIFLLTSTSEWFPLVFPDAFISEIE